MNAEGALGDTIDIKFTTVLQWGRVPTNAERNKTNVRIDYGFTLQWGRVSYERGRQ
jgi:hypothetical protein